MHILLEDRPIVCEIIENVVWYYNDNVVQNYVLNYK